METSKAGIRDIKPHAIFKIPERSDGLYHSNTINKAPEDVYAFIKEVENLKKVFLNFPKEIENFLDLKIVSAQSPTTHNYEVKFKNNPEAKIQGTLSLTLNQGPAAKGTVVYASAKFGNYSSKDDGPSDLINLFLKRVKALVETGELATTDGQPNGKDETERATTKH